MLSSSGCRRRRAVGLSLSSRRRSSWSPWSPSCRRPSVSPRVGVSCRAVAVPVAPLVGWVGFGGCRWVGVGRPGRGSSVAGVALAGRRRRPVGVVPVPLAGGRHPLPVIRAGRGSSGSVAVPLAGVGSEKPISACHKYTPNDTQKHPRLYPIITDYNEIHPEKLPKASKSSLFRVFSCFRCRSGCRAVAGAVGAVSVGRPPSGCPCPPVAGRPVSCPRPCPCRSVSVGVSGCRSGKRARAKYNRKKPPRCRPVSGRFPVL